MVNLTYRITTFGYASAQRRPTKWGQSTFEVPRCVGATTHGYTLALVLARIYYGAQRTFPKPREGGDACGDFVDALIATIASFAAETTLWEVTATTLCAWLALFATHLVLTYRELEKKYADSEAQLIARTVGKQSVNWANTADNLERKALDPGNVARTSAMTHLHMLDEAANAWLKGSKWASALGVTRQCLSEACHTISKPSLLEDNLLSAADLIERRLATYADLSKASNEAKEVALQFLDTLDKMLAIPAYRPRIEALREQVAMVKAQIEIKKEQEKTRATLFSLLTRDQTSDTP